jgi:hypothetical protein
MRPQTLIWFIEWHPVAQLTPSPTTGNGQRARRNALRRSGSGTSSCSAEGRMGCETLMLERSGRLSRRQVPRVRSTALREASASCRPLSCATGRAGSRGVPSGIRTRVTALKGPAAPRQGTSRCLSRHINRGVASDTPRGDPRRLEGARGASPSEGNDDGCHSTEGHPAPGARGDRPQPAAAVQRGRAAGHPGPVAPPHPALGPAAGPLAQPALRGHQADRPGAGRVRRRAAAGLSFEPDPTRWRRARPTP